MIVAGAWAVGARVTVLATIKDPPHLELHPYVAIVEVVEGNGEPAYVVEHIETPCPIRYGPFPQSRLLPGWRL